VETPSFYGYLTGRENLRLLGNISGGVSGSRVDEVLDLVGLFPRAGDKVKGYSQGMRQRLGIAQALLASPEIIILDEPTNGLDPSGIIEMRRLIKRLATEHGISIFISSHLLHEIEAVCRHVAVINNGTLMAQGSVDELLQKETICLELKVSDVKKAREIFAGLNFIPSVREENGRGIEITIARDRVAEVNRRLVEGGIDVLSLIPREASLEDFFLELTGGASGDRASARASGGVANA
jgi:ABC-2 type transport system ATP-binding protein